MPQTKKTNSRASSTLRSFKEPAALKRLTKSLESAQDALSQLQSHAGRDVSQGARDIYKELKSFVSSARKDTTKFAKALQKDFEMLQRSVTGGSTPTPARKTTARKPAATAAKKRTTSSRARTASRSSSRRTSSSSSSSSSSSGAGQGS